MRLLVATHAVHWWLTSDQRLSDAAGAATETPAHEVHVSALTAYELALLYRRRRLVGRAEALLPTLAGQGFVALPVTADHALAAAALPGHHGDPIDRMLVARALAGALTVVSKDRQLTLYGVPVLW